MQITTIRFLPAPLIAALLAGIQFFALPPQAMSEETPGNRSGLTFRFGFPKQPKSEESEEVPAKKISRGPDINAEMLRPLLEGVWSWKLGRGEEEGTTSRIFSIDENLHVLSTARIIEGTGLVVTPGMKPTRINVTVGAQTGLITPEVGSILKLPMPGNSKSTVRLLLKSATAKKLKCIDLTDRDNPKRITLTKTNDRLLQDINGAGQQPIAQVPAEQPKPTPPPSTPPAVPPTSVPEDSKNEPEKRSILSFLQRRKEVQVEEGTETKTSEPPPATPAPPRKSFFSFLHGTPSEETDERPATKITRAPDINAEMLRPLLRGTWTWKLSNQDEDGATSRIFSFDENLRVLGTARIINGAGLVVTPDMKPTQITFTVGTQTGLKSPEIGSVLKLPMPGNSKSTVRLLLKSATAKKLECIDLADLENPRKITIAKTNDRLLQDIEGPGHQPIAQVPEEPAQLQPPSPLPPRTFAPTPAPAVMKSTIDNKRPALSVFERLKEVQAETETAPPASGVSSSTPTPTKKSPETTATPIRDMITKERPRVISTFDRLKEEQEKKKAEAKAERDRANVPPSNAP